MNQPLEYEVHPKENLYFIIKVVISIFMYLIIAYGIFAFVTKDTTKTPILYVIVFYASIIVSVIVFQLGIFIGYLKGNAVKVSRTQFADISHVVERQSQLLGLSKAPDVYILQSGGVLNAFATRFFGADYIVLFSEVVEAAYTEDKKLLEFIIGHELGHVQRKHLIKRLILLPSFVVPFLGPAYSRACEYTCDSIGHTLCPEGARNGLLLLVSGKSLFKKINTEEYIRQGYNEAGFWHWFAEKVSTHPHITKRVEKFKEAPKAKFIAPKREPEAVLQEEPSTVFDHTKYMPT